MSSTEHHSTVAILADVHVNLSKDVEFESNRFKQLVRTIAVRQYSKVIIAGDLFDKARPSLEEIKLVTEQITYLAQHCDVYILAGNHEAVTKTTTTYDYLPLLQGVTVVKNSVLNINGKTIRLVDWNEVKRLDATTAKTDVLVSHFRSNLGHFIKEELNTKTISKLAPVVVLGDIHQAYSPLPNVVYCSSPYSTKYTSPGSTTYGYISLELSDEGVSVSRVTLNLPSKFKLSYLASEIHNVLPFVTNGHLLKVEVTGTLLELSNLPQHNNVTYIKNCTNTEVQQEVSTEVQKPSQRLSNVDNICNVLSIEVRQPAKELLTAIEKEI